MIKEIINNKDFKITSQRLTLVPATQDDAEIYYKKFNSNIAKYQISAPFNSITAASELLKNFSMFKKNGIHLILNIMNTDNIFIGSLEIYNLHTSSPEIGLWISEEYQNKGYAYESILAFINFIKKNSDITEIIYEADIRNINSIKLVKKLKAIKQNFHIVKNDIGKELKLNQYLLVISR